MSTGLRRQLRCSSASLRSRIAARAAGTGDEGFTMIEMIVAMVIIGIVMSALATFFVSTVSATASQGVKQSAVQLADDAVERTRAIKGSSVVTGRDKASTDTQWASPAPGVAAYLADMTKAWDSTAGTNAGVNAALPTTAKSVTINNLPYQQNWYVGSCFQPASGGACGTSQSTGYVAFYRVVVAVTWPEKTCTNRLCSYITSTLVSNSSSEPIFNSNGTAVAPVVNNPGNQTGEIGQPVSLQMTTSSASSVVSWAASYLPAGLTISSVGLIAGNPTTAAPYTVTVSATDAFGLVGSAVFNWTVNAGPVLSSPGTQTTTVGTAVSLAPSLTGGTPPYAWVASGLPAGLAIDASSGVISGSPTTIGTSAVTVTVTDTFGQSSTTTFSWIVPALAAVTPATQVSDVGLAIPGLQMTATGGNPPYKTWAASGLPTGLAISTTTGKITGTPTAAGSYPNVIVTVTDNASKTSSTAKFTWTVNAAVKVTAPAAQNDGVGGTSSATATATLGSGGYTWTASNLPAGLSINASTGVMSGTPTTAGTKSVTVTATDSLGQAGSASFNWVIQPALAATTPATQASDLGVAVSVQFAATGGVTPYKNWSATGLPAGLTMSATTGLVTGTPTTLGTYANIVVTVSDSDSVTASTAKFSWTINAVPNITFPVSNQNVSRGQAIPATASTATGGSGTLRWTVTGLPPGITMTTAGVFSGTPTTNGSYNLVLTVTDSAGGTDNQAFKIVVS